MSGINTCSNICPRGRVDCLALSNIVSGNEETFLCFGRNNGNTRVNDQDVYRYCCVADGIDEMQDLDRRDAMHQIAVISTGLSVDEEQNDV